MARFSGQITVAAVGKMKEKHWLAAQSDYTKRLGRYIDFTLVEVKDRVGRGQPDGVARQREGEELLQAAAGANRVIALTENGRLFTSLELADYVQKLMLRNGRLAFLLGGPLGFAEGVLAAAHDQLALSPLTFPHELARVLLLEQLYRVFTLLNQEKYHK